MNLGRSVNAVVQPLLLSAELGRRQAPSEASHWRYRSFAELLLREGHVFTTPMADLVPERRRGPTGQCFANASAYSADDGLIYAEGFAGTVRVPVGVEHAWCLADSGAVLDPTWPVGLGAVYVGVAVTAAYRRFVAHPSLLHRTVMVWRSCAMGFPRAPWSPSRATVRRGRSRSSCRRRRARAPH